MGDSLAGIERCTTIVFIGVSVSVENSQPSRKAAIGYSSKLRVSKVSCVSTVRVGIIDSKGQDSVVVEDDFRLEGVHHSVAQERNVR